MLATYVKPRQTLLTLEEAANAMRLALHSQLDADPSLPTLALALGKTALETGRWGANGGMWNGNWGNIKASESYQGLYTAISLNECGKLGVQWYAPEGLLNHKGGTVIADRYMVPPAHPATRMRAYNKPADGATDYVKFVAGGRYMKAWARLLAGDAQGYVHELKAAGYFTAPEDTYMKAVVSLRNELAKKLSGLPHNEPTVEVPPVDEVRAWLAPQDIVALEAELTDRYFDVLGDKSDRDADMQGDVDANGEMKA